MKAQTRYLPITVAEKRRNAAEPFAMELVAIFAGLLAGCFFIFVPATQSSAVKPPAFPK
jgi:hypothetical protein